jgi:single-stranded-DNA-specific exonuclease
MDALDGPVWGQGFAAPSFHSQFQVLAQRAVGTGHLKLTLRSARTGNPRSGTIDAIWFGRAEPAPDRLHAIWQPIRNTWQGRTKIELQILHSESAG